MRDATAMRCSRALYQWLTVGWCATAIVILGVDCSPRNTPRVTYTHRSYETPTPAPTPAVSRAALAPFLLPMRTMSRSNIAFMAELDQRSYSFGMPIMIRFRLTNRTEAPLTILDLGPLSIAALTLRDQRGASVKRDPKLVRPVIVIAIPVMRLKPGITRLTQWFSLSEWGFRPINKGAYVLIAVPNFRSASDALLIDNGTKSSSAYASRNTLQFSIR